MSAPSFHSRVTVLLALGAALLFTTPARALQPLQTFLASAQKANPDALEAVANLAQQDALAQTALGRALPGIQLKGTYTHNQYNAEVTLAPGTQPLVLQLYDQFDFYATLNVPLVDLAQFKRIAAARRGAELTKLQLDAVRLQVSGAIAQDYYQLVANLALVQASKRQLEVAKKSLELTQDRFQLGGAPEIDVDRAKSEVERQVQQLASAGLQQAIAQRALASASGIEPAVEDSADFVEDLHQEAPLEELEKSVSALPQLQAAALSVEQAAENAEAQKLALFPTLSGQFVEHGSNSGGFTGTDWSYFFVFALTWNFDYTSVTQIHAQNAAADAARARDLRARLAAGDAVSLEWNSVRAAIARSQSARSELQTSQHAEALASDRYRVGAATQLDLLQAQRDAFSAEVSRIQADADLANARAQLRLSVGKSLSDGAPTAPIAAPLPPPAPAK
jgi:outer membrane protein TolC